MPEPTPEQLIGELYDKWASLKALGEEASYQDFVAAEEQFDADLEEFFGGFSHPPGRPNRRR